MPEPEVTVVIPVKNGADVIHVQLEALAAQVDAPPFEVVVSDNGSTDDLEGALRGWRDRLYLRVVDSGDRSGPSHARNLGVRVARADKILFCDADDRVSPYFVRSLSRSLDSADIAGGWVEMREVNSDLVRSWVMEPPRSGLPSTMSFLPYVLAGCFGARRDAYVAVGGFDERFLGHEEIDFSWRAQLGGFSLAFSADAFVHYAQRDTIRGLIRQRFRYGYTYAQLYSRFRDQPIPRTPLKLEVRKILHLLRQGPGAMLDPGARGRWFGQVAWVAGRLRGDLDFRVRAPQ